LDSGCQQSASQPISNPSLMTWSKGNAAGLRAPRVAMVDSPVAAGRVKPRRAAEQGNSREDVAGAEVDTEQVRAVEAAAAAVAAAVEAADIARRRTAAVEQQARMERAEVARVAAAAATAAAAAAAVTAAAAAAVAAEEVEQLIAAEAGAATATEEEMATAAQEARLVDKLQEGAEAEQFEREPLLRPPEEPVWRPPHPERTLGLPAEPPPADPPGLDRMTAKLALSAPLRAPRDEVAAGERVACQGGMWALVAAAGADDAGAALAAALEEQERLRGVRGLMDYVRFSCPDFQALGGSVWGRA